MASNGILLSLLLLGLISAATSTTAPIGEPIKDPNDPYVTEIAKFAVSEHNKDASTQLVFVKIVIGHKLIGRGAIYNLFIIAKNAVAGDSSVAGGVREYLAIVYDLPSKGYRRLDFFSGVN